MPIGDSISQPIPPVGTAGTGYASQLVAFLTEVKARLEAKVALASLLTGLFDLSNNGIANAKYVGLYEQSSTPSTPVGSLQRYGGELYYVSPSGAVRITLNGNLDVVGANGITGDYAAPAEFRYDLGALEYFAYSDQTAAPKKWARVGAHGFDVYGTLTSTTRVRLSWGGGSSWTLTLPTAPPGTQQVIQMDASGNLVASNTVPQSLTVQQTVTATSYLYTAQESLLIPAMAGKPTGTQIVTAAGAAWDNNGSTAWIYYPICVMAGTRIRECNVYCSKGSNAGVSIECDLIEVTSLTRSTSVVASAIPNSANAPGNITMDITGLTKTTVTGKSYVVRVRSTAAASGLDVYGDCRVVIDRPA